MGERTRIEWPHITVTDPDGHEWIEGVSGHTATFIEGQMDVIGRLQAALRDAVQVIDDEIDEGHWDCPWGCGGCANMQHAAGCELRAYSELVGYDLDSGVMRVEGGNDG
jgi:hypothetical protein